MVFCNIFHVLQTYDKYQCHNPYFNRWFSAITITKKEDKDIKVTILILIDGFLQYYMHASDTSTAPRHNPYFNRWFSAIIIKDPLITTII